MRNNKKEFEFKIIKEILVISESPNEDGWDKVLTVISWNGGKPKLDLRSWNKDRTKMGKGISLSGDEFNYLIESTKDYDFMKYLT